MKYSNAILSFLFLIYVLHQQKKPQSHVKKHQKHNFNFHLCGFMSATFCQTNEVAMFSKILMTS